MSSDEAEVAWRVDRVKAMRQASAEVAIPIPITAGGRCPSCGARARCPPCTEAVLRVIDAELKWLSRWLNGDFDLPAALTPGGDRLIPVAREPLDHDGDYGPEASA